MSWSQIFFDSKLVYSVLVARDGRLGWVGVIARRYLVGGTPKARTLELGIVNGLP